MRGKTGNRILYLDVLRIFSVVGVMLIHFPGKILSDASMGTQNWYLFLVLNCLGRFAVPVFFMISGSLFLDPGRKVDGKRLFTHNIRHLITAFGFWSICYTLWNLFTVLLKEEITTTELCKKLIKSLVLGPTHLWFVFVLIALYMIIPFLRQIAADRKLTEYFLILWVIFTMLSSFTNPIDGLSLFREFIGKFQMRFVFGYSGYFLLGCYLNKYYDPSKNKRIMIYCVGVAGYLFTCFATGRLSWQKGSYVETYLEGGMLNCLFMAVAVYILVKTLCEHCKENGRGAALVHRIAEKSFGIYLMHMLVFYVIQLIGLPELFGGTLADVCVTLFCVYACSYFLCCILMNVPYVGKRIL